MTPEQKVNAVYDWIEGHCYYIADFDKTDYMQAPYLMTTTNRGDYFGFYAISRVLFDRMGLPNLTYPTRTCLITDADLETFKELMPNYYFYDHDSFQKTPAA